VYQAHVVQDIRLAHQVSDVAEQRQRLLLARGGGLVVADLLLNDA
jgi:hypothetical protein